MCFGLVRLAMALVAIASASSCSREITVHAYDKASLEALGKYDPVYELDNDGRVVDLKLENKQLDEAAFDALSKLTAMRGLSLYGSSVTDAGLEKLQAVGQLQALGLGATPVTDKGVAHLAKLPELRWLWLSGEDTISAKAVKELLKALPNLEVYRQG